MGGINFGPTPDEREIQIEAIKDRIREAQAREDEEERRKRCEAIVAEAVKQFEEERATGKKIMRVEIDPEAFTRAFRESIKAMNGMDADTHEAQTPAESGKEPLAECVANNLLDMLDIIDSKMTYASDADDVERLAEAACKIALTLHQCGLLEK